MTDTLHSRSKPAALNWSESEQLSLGCKAPCSHEDSVLLFDEQRKVDLQLQHVCCLVEKISYQRAARRGGVGRGVFCSYGST